MATPNTNKEPYINSDRVTNSTYLDFVVCSLCQGILWIPKACKNCQTAYCSTCIKNRQVETSEPIKCPNDCSRFEEHRCPLIVNNILNRLEIKCRNTPYGCKEILSYNSLETHEEECGFLQKYCSGCGKFFAKKDFDNHHNTCPLVELTCSDCNTIYQRQNKDKHTETICLRVQLRQQKERLDRLERIVLNTPHSKLNNLHIPNISEVNE